MIRGGRALLSWEEAGDALPRMRPKAGAILLLALLPACSTAPERAPALGEGFVGPYELNVREALVARAKLADTVKHGERVEILGRRRSFYKVRTARGREGWVDARQLLSAQEMDNLRRLAQRAEEAPPQGEATVLDELNVHTAPYRQAPSFRRIKQGERVEVIAYERVPRKPYVPQPLLRAGASKQQATRAKGRKQKVQAPPLAPVPAPAPPPDLMELSRTAAPREETNTAVAKTSALPAVPADEWALVRCKDGAAGWVLARMLFLAIPDEVAQYAERAKIMAYFAIGTVPTRNGDKPAWLWATQSQRNAGHDFDSLRIFVWSTRRSRYETAFIERGLKGNLPLRLQKGRAGMEAFEADVEERSGERVTRTYTIAPGTFRAKLTKRSPAGGRTSWLSEEAAPRPEAAAPAPAAGGWLERVGGWLGALRARFSR